MQMVGHQEVECRDGERRKEGRWRKEGGERKMDSSRLVCEEKCPFNGLES